MRPAYRETHHFADCSGAEAEAWTVFRALHMGVKLRDIPVSVPEEHMIVGRRFIAGLSAS